MSCTICTEQLQQSRQPKVLSCGHTFCVVCIGEWFTTHRKQYNTRCNYVECPVCRRKTTLPEVESGVVSLPTNFGLLEAVEETRAALAVDVCDDDVSERTCSTHAGKLLAYSCETCGGKLVCGQCVKSQHQPAAGHRIASFQTIVEREQNEKAELQRKVLELQQINSELALTNYANLQLEEPDRHHNGGQAKLESPPAPRTDYRFEGRTGGPLSASSLTRTGSLPAARFQNESRQPLTLPIVMRELENRILAQPKLETTLRADGITADSVPNEMVPKGTVPTDTVPKGTVPRETVSGGTATDNIITTVVLPNEIQRVHTRLRPVSVHISQEKDSVTTPNSQNTGLRSRWSSVGSSGTPSGPPKPAPRPRSIAGHQLVSGGTQSQRGSWQPQEHSDGRPVVAPRPISVLAPRNPLAPSDQLSNSNDNRSTEPANRSPNETETDDSLSARDKLARILQLSLHGGSQA